MQKRMGRSMKNTSRVYTRSIPRFRGVDFSVDDTALSFERFANMKNMWKDWQSDDGPAVEAFPGYRILASFGKRIYGLFIQRIKGEEYLLLHADEKLFRFSTALCHQPAALSAQAPIFSALPNKEGCGFQSGEYFYLLVDGKLFRIDEVGACRALPDETDLPYVPTVFYNGSHHEQRNLLTDEVREVLSAEALEEGESTPYDNLVFLPLPNASGCCAVKAGGPIASPSSVIIPRFADIEGVTYIVTGIAANGFSGLTNLVSVSIPDTVTEIGAYAFAGCLSLSEITLPSSVRYIWNHAFAFCPFLTTVTLSESLSSVGADAFMGDERLTSVYFPYTEAAFRGISFEDDPPFPETVTVYFEATATQRALKLFVCPVYSPALSVEKAFLGSERISEGGSLLDGAFVRYVPLVKDGLVSSVCLLTSDPAVLLGRSLTLQLLASPSLFATPKGFKAFGEGGLSLTGREAVLGCRATGEYDGRIFFTGNPLLPNTVFFSAPDETGYNNPLYIGNLNYFNDGLSSVPNRALLGTGDVLMVIKEDGTSESGIYYHSGESTTHAFVPRIYPAKSGAAGIGAVGGAINFRDDPVFLTEGGLLSVSRQAVNLERSLVNRSRSVNLRLCRQKLSCAKMAVFEGYLCLLTDGNLYLADSRETYRYPTGELQYEWYFITGIGDFENDTPLYRYAEALPKGADGAHIQLSERGGEEAEGTVYSTLSEEGEMLYYVKNGDLRYAVDTDGERKGGVLSPASLLVAGKKALYFATENGKLGCFNTDKRGLSLYRTLPSSLYCLQNGRYTPLSLKGGDIQSEDAISHIPLYAKEEESFREVGSFPVYQNGEEISLAALLEEGKPGRIPAFYYSFNGHRYPVGCATAKDDGGLPQLRKNTLSGTLALRLKLLGPVHLRVEARTDKRAWHTVDICQTDTADFEGADFSAFSFSEDTAVTLPIREKERGFSEKQLAFFSEVFRSPFGIYSLAYSYTPAGKL